jgi:hypothetical protein
MSNSATLMFEILDQQLVKLLTPQGVIKQDRQDGTVAFALERKTEYYAGAGEISTGHQYVRGSGIVC